MLLALNTKEKIYKGELFPFRPSKECLVCVKNWVYLSIIMTARAAAAIKARTIISSRGHELYMVDTVSLIAVFAAADSAMLS